MPNPSEAILGSLLGPAGGGVMAMPLFSLSDSTGHGILTAEGLASVSTSEIVFSHHSNGDGDGGGGRSWMTGGVRLWARIRHGRGDDWSCAL